MEMKRTILSFSFVLAAMLAHAQLTLEGCQHSAQTNYPLVRQYGLIEKAREYNLENAGKGYLPQFTLSGKPEPDVPPPTGKPDTGRTGRSHSPGRSR